MALVTKVARQVQPFRSVAIRPLAPILAFRTVMSGTTAPPTIGQAKAGKKAPNLVMQIILPKSLVTEDKWPVGPLMAQSAHAATAVLHRHNELPEVKEYLADLDGMRKTVLEVPDETALRTLASKLDSLDPKIPYYLWIEQPENIRTALALAPNRRPKALRTILDQAGCQLWQ